MSSGTSSLPTIAGRRRATSAAVVAIALAGFACDSASPGADRTPTKFTIESRYLGERREAWVHLPADYADSAGSYPVLYVLDTEWVFDLAVASMEFLSGELAEKIPPMIVVGIPNTDRDRDFSVSFDSTAAFTDFLRYLEHELVPRVDGEYRTKPHRSLYGWSSASNICLWMLLTKPHLFDGYVASGTGISQRVHEFAPAQFATRDYGGKRLYACSEGDTPRRDALRLLTELLETSAPAGMRWECEIMERDDHAAVLATGLLAGLDFLFADETAP